MVKGTFVSLILVAVLFFLVAGYPVRAESPAQTEAPWWEPQIAIVWPHDGEGRPTAVDRARAVNVSIWPRNSISCDERAPFRLLMAQGNEPARYLSDEGSRRLRLAGGNRFPTIEYNDLSLDLDANPGAPYRFVLHGEFFPTRLGFMGNVWVHAADPRTILPEAVVPTGYAPEQDPKFKDVRIQIVWPHDGQGNPVPVAEATHVNIAVDIFEQGTLNSLPPDQPFADPAASVQLYMAEGNGPLRRLEIPAELSRYTVEGQEYPRWLFNDVPVRPGQQSHFLATVTGLKASSPHSSIWTHAADARTFQPNPPVPAACRP